MGVDCPTICFAQCSCGLPRIFGGEGGIRTHVQSFGSQLDFESSPLRPLRYLSSGKKPTKVPPIRQREIVHGGQSLDIIKRRFSPEGAIVPDPSFYSRLGRLSSVILALPSSMAVGWLFGHFVVDRFLPTGPWGTVGFTLLGAVIGFYEIVQILVADQRSKDD